MVLLVSCNTATLHVISLVTFHQFLIVRKFIDFRERDVEKPSEYGINGP